ncbi:MAG TPA: glycosyltransferase family 4 protein [Sphingomicrobium sp.]|nr:glycosyltransferase family 4 protein [Sphingomicrobium sp.]
MSRIIFINRFFFPDESATSQILTDLAAHLSRNGFEVCVITSRASLQGSRRLAPRETVLGGVEVRRVRSATVASRSLGGKLMQLAAFYPLAFLELLSTLSPGDLVVAKTDPPLVSTIAWLASKIRGARLVNWLQDVYPEVAAELQTPVLSGAVGTVLRLLRNVSLKGATANVAIGRVMADKLKSEGVPSARIRVIPNWADEEALRPISTMDSRARKEWGLGRDDFVLAYSGNLGRAHEAETLLGAASILSERKDIKFLFIGGGHEYERLKSRVEEQGLKNFLFKAHQPREELEATLGAADAHWLSLRPELEGLIVPSKFYGILAAGRPIIAVSSLRGEVGTIVCDSGCGFAVEPGDSRELASAIARLADDPELRRKMGSRARELSETMFPRKSALRSWTDLVTSLEKECAAGRLGPSAVRSRSAISLAK